MFFRVTCTIAWILQLGAAAVEAPQLCTCVKFCSFIRTHHGFWDKTKSLCLRQIYPTLWSSIGSSSHTPMPCLLTKSANQDNNWTSLLILWWKMCIIIAGPIFWQMTAVCNKAFQTTVKTLRTGTSKMTVDIPHCLIPPLLPQYWSWSENKLLMQVEPITLMDRCLKK